MGEQQDGLVRFLRGTPEVSVERGIDPAGLPIVDGQQTKWSDQLVEMVGGRGHQEQGSVRAEHAVELGCVMRREDVEDRGYAAGTDWECLP
jgi:hypothetical protein